MYNPVQPISILEYLQSLMNAASIKLPDPNQDRFLREPEVLRMTALSRSAMYRRIKDGTFPKHFKIGGHYKMWSLNEVQRWMGARRTQPK